MISRAYPRLAFRLVILTCWIALPATVVLAADPNYDLIVRNGRIVDGTGNPWYFGDVALRANKIVAVGRIPQSATREIDATGLIVSPGFIDIHSHSDTLLLEDGGAHSKIRQGVTTEVLGEGDSAAPALGRIPARKLTVGDRTLQWSTFTEYFDLLDREGTAVNVASYVGLGAVWRCVMGDSFDRPSDEQRQQMRELVRQAMADGAMGLSSMLAQPPGSLTTTDDVVDLCCEVAKSGGIYSTHIRNEGTGVFEAVKEAIEIGERATIPVDIIHLKIADQQYWGRMREIIALIEAARTRGVNVQAHVYPYTRGNNDLDSIVPPWAHEGGVTKLRERLRDPEARERIKRDIRQGIPGWYNHYSAVGGDWSRMQISKETTLKGLTMDRVLSERSRGKTPTPEPLDVFLDYLNDENGSVSTVYAHHTEEDMNAALVQPWCSVGSDGLAFAADGPLRRGNPHPRSFGTFPRILGVYVRELKLLRLEDAVRKMTSLNAAKIGLHDRGLIAPGQFADLVLFDPVTIIDRATYTEPFQYPEGIIHVIVNGQIVIDHGKLTAARPGKSLRHTAN
ncbi:MAG: D-aminoacylase [Planctomycetes bacterium]|nr:D-aminoacylase [Planctomycetota bacterium]